MKNISHHTFLQRHDLCSYSFRFLLSVFLLCLIPFSAFALIPVIDFTSVLKLMQEISLMQQEYQTLQAQASDIHQQLNAIKALGSGQYKWSNVESLINELGENMNQSNALAYSAQNINSQFQTIFPGYQPAENYTQSYQTMMNTSQNTFNATLQSLNTNASDFTNSQQRMAFLEQQAQSAQGQTQAIQASAQIAAEQVSQLQLLRQVAIAQTNAQTVYYASQVQQQATKESMQQQIISNGSTNMPNYGSGPGLTPPSIP